MSIYLFVIGFTFTVGIYGLAAAIAQAAGRRRPTMPRNNRGAGA